MRHRYRALVKRVLSACFLLSSCAGAAGPAVTGPELLYRLDLLPRLRDAVRIGAFSSYDRTGGNDDGFSGKHSFLRREAGGLVLAELEGPGAIYRIWTPTPTDDQIEFYFDGDPAPRIRVRFREVFSGKEAPFLSPLVGSGAGGYYSYVPLQFRRSCKVVARAEDLRFYQINYALYAPGSEIETFTMPPGPAFFAGLRRAGELLASAGSDIAAHAAPPGAKTEIARSNVSLAPGRPVDVFKTSRPGRIVGLRLRPASAFEGKDRAVVIRMYWDNAASPAVNSPASDFFGYAWGWPATRSLLVGTDGDTNYCYFPMPFDRTARIQLFSEKAGGQPIDIQTEVVWAAVPRRPDEGRFYAAWRRENPTRTGEPFTFLNTSGRGHLVGAILQAQGSEPGNTLFFEGDDQTTIDGQLAIHGTGSEDFFNGGWYNVAGRWDRRVSLPLSGSLLYRPEQARTGGYRLMLSDAYSYHESLSLTIEHAPTGNSLATDYTGVAFFYSLHPPGQLQRLPAAPDRSVADPPKIVYLPGNRLPVFELSRDTKVSKTRQQVDGARTGVLSVEPNEATGFVAFEFDLPESAVYSVHVQALTGPSQGTIRLCRDEEPLGPAIDMYRAHEGSFETLSLGNVGLEQGANLLFLRITGKNPKSAASRLDISRVIFAKKLPQEAAR